jgi:hypothetical protein
MAAAIPGLAASSPKLVGYGAYGLGKLGRTAAEALDRAGPLARLPCRPKAQSTFQLGRIPANPFRPSDTTAP